MHDISLLAAVTRSKMLNVPRSLAWHHATMLWICFECGPFLTEFSSIS